MVQAATPCKLYDDRINGQIVKIRVYPAKGETTAERRKRRRALRARLSDLSSLSGCLHLLSTDDKLDLYVFLSLEIKTAIDRLNRLMQQIEDVNRLESEVECLRTVGQIEEAKKMIDRRGSVLDRVKAWPKRRSRRKPTLSTHLPGWS